MQQEPRPPPTPRSDDLEARLTAITSRAEIDGTTANGTIEWMQQLAREHINYATVQKAIPINVAITTVTNISQRGLLTALQAGATQGVYVGLTAGVNSRLCQRLALREPHKRRAQLTATAVCGLGNFVAMYGLHTMMGSPRPLLSALLPSIPNAISAYLNADYFQREHDGEVEVMALRDAYEKNGFSGAIDWYIHTMVRRDLRHDVKRGWRSITGYDQIDSPAKAEETDGTS